MGLLKGKNKKTDTQNQGNTFRVSPDSEEAEKPVRKRKAKAHAGANSAEGYSKYITFIGVVVFGISVFSFLACISYLFNWRADQSVILEGARLDNPPGNMMGWIGAWWAHLLMFNGPGVSILLVLPLTGYAGLKLWWKDKLRIPQPPILNLLWLSLWFSVGFGFVLPNIGSGVFAGKLGYNLALRIQLFAGPLGTTLLLIGSFLGLYYSFFGKSFIPASLWKKLFQKPSTINSNVPDSILNEIESEEIDGNEAPLQTEIYTHRDELSMENAGDETQDLELQLELSKDVNNVEQGFVPEIEIVSVIESNAEELSPAQKLVREIGEYNHTLDLPHFVFPGLDLLADLGDSELKVNKQELEDNKVRIVETLGNYGVGIQKIKATIGPTVTLYEIVPAPGVRISKIKNLEDDIALSLAAHGIRIIAPIPGKGTIGIEVPNQSPTIVGLKPVLENEKFANTKFDLPIALGRTIANEVFVADLAKMPHLLVAGATGQGKSVGINTLLVSLLYKKHPTELKFVMVDPKKVELTLYALIEKHYLAKLPNEDEAIITDVKKVVNTLNSLCIEMDNRYELLKDAQVRNLKEYNLKFSSRRLNPNDGHRYLPFIVLVIDEFADLIMTAGKEVELPIARLAQLARAVGIHLIIATQRPSVNIITGTIKANFPARLAFRVTSKIDSRTILDAGGADQLIGRGDMLLSLGSDLIRLQCPFVDTPEVERVVEFIAKQNGFPMAMELPEYAGEGDEGGAKLSLDDKDELFDRAALIIVQSQQGSASLLQRKMNIGFNRAGRLIDQMEAAGIVGSNKGSKPREVLIQDESSLQRILDNFH